MKESRVEDRGSCISKKEEGKCENNRRGDEVYPATFGNEGKNGLQLDDDDNATCFTVTAFKITKAFQETEKEQ